ncbi:Clp protease N-terminal domain-containing protein [Kitasatospora sp. NPDC097605]|uniref:Clp protease N-terminal domain-containing protein n=1 Tax=Kitasatospora sp. NPDC097605 TaxID=3157226 RepID=UPI00332480BB
MFDDFSDRARRAVILARTQALAHGHEQIDTTHLLLGLLDDRGDADRILTACGVDPGAVRQEAESRIGHGAHHGSVQYSPGAESVFKACHRSAAARGDKEVRITDLLRELTVRRPGERAAEVLAHFGVTGRKIELLTLGAALPPPAPPTALSSLTRDLTAAARGDSVRGRQSELEQVTQVLRRHTRNVALLVGDPGVGKTSVVLGLAEAIAQGRAPTDFHGRTVRLLDVGALFADPKHHGRFTELMAELVGDILEVTGLVLFLDNALATVRTREGQTEALTFLRPVFGHPGVAVVAAATTAEYQRWERDSGLDRTIVAVPVHEPATDDVLEILRDARPRLVEHHGVEITDGALEAAARLAPGHLPGQALPGAAVDLLDEAAARVRSEPATAGTAQSVTHAVVERTAGSSVALPRPPVSPPVPHDPFVWSMS